MPLACQECQETKTRLHFKHHSPASAVADTEKREAEQIALTILQATRKEQADGRPLLSPEQA